MEMNKLQRTWQHLGQSDPLWAILSDPQLKGRKWPIDEFFETGVREIDEVMDYIDHLGIAVCRGRALDFGCGVGRLTQRLADYFDEVCGVDIAPSMIELARKRNQRGSRCTYYQNDANDLGLFTDNSFDFIYSNLVLQHIPPQYSKNYFQEFLRVLKPGGLLIFQLIGEKNEGTVKGRIRALAPSCVLDLKARVMSEGIRMYGIQKSVVITLLETSGAKTVDVQQHQAGSWPSFRYAVVKLPLHQPSEQGLPAGFLG